MEAFAELGVGKAVEIGEAWRLLDGKMDDQGRIVLEGTPPRSKEYLPRERVGKPSKWATVYAHLAYSKRQTAGQATRAQREQLLARKGGHYPARKGGHYIEGV